MLNPFAQMNNIADTRTIACPVYDTKGNITRTDTITINGLGHLILECVRVALESVTYWIKRLIRGVLITEVLVATIGKPRAHQLHIELGVKKIPNHYAYVSSIVRRPLESLADLTALELNEVLAVLRSGVAA